MEKHLDEYVKLCLGTGEEKEAAFVNELMRYESKTLVEGRGSDPASFLDSFSDQLGEEDEVKRRRVLEMEKRFL